MKRALLIANSIAAIIFMILAIVASGAYATHAHSTYHDLVVNRIVLEPTTYADGTPFDVEAKLRQIGATGFWFSLIGFGAASVCIANGLLFFFAADQKRNPEKLSVGSA